MEMKPAYLSVTKSAANGQVYDVISYDEYGKNFDMYNGRTDVAVSANCRGKDIILPIKGKYSGNPISPGVYDAGCVDFFNYPDETTIERYVPTNTVHMSNREDIGNLIKSGEIAKRLDEPFITTPDNITNIPIKETDQPEMVALKTALNSKHIDIDKYAGRFGDNYPNDKRQLKNSNATLKIIKRFCENCDMEAILTFRDKNPDVPNPMNTEITVSLTDDIDEEDSENLYSMIEDCNDSSDDSDE